MQFQKDIKIDEQKVKYLSLEASYDRDMELKDPEIEEVKKEYAGIGRKGPRMRRSKDSFGIREP